MSLSDFDMSFMLASQNELRSVCSLLVLERVHVKLALILP